MICNAGDACITHDQKHESATGDAEITPVNWAAKSIFSNDFHKRKIAPVEYGGTIKVPNIPQNISMTFFKLLSHD